MIRPLFILLAFCVLYFTACKEEQRGYNKPSILVVEDIFQIEGNSTMCRYNFADKNHGEWGSITDTIGKYKVNDTINR